MLPTAMNISAERSIPRIFVVMDRTEVARLRTSAIAPGSSMGGSLDMSCRQKPPFVDRWWPVFGFATSRMDEFAYSWQLPLQSRNSAAV